MPSIRRNNSADIQIERAFNVGELMFIENPPACAPLIARITCDPCSPDVAMDIEDVGGINGNVGVARVIHDELEGALRYPIESPHFILTDYTIGGKPAFWMHKLKYDVWHDALGRRNVSLTDRNGIAVPRSRWNYDADRNALYLTFRNEPYAPDGPHVYYVNYIRSDSSNTVVDQSHSEMLDADYVCHEITPLDTNCINQVGFGTHSYEITINTDRSIGSSIIVSVPSTRKHYIEYTSQNRIYVTKPDATDLRLPWYCNVFGTSTFKSFTPGSDSTLAGYLMYTVKERLYQNYYPWYPIMLSPLVTATKVGYGIYTVLPGDLVVSENTPFKCVVSRRGTVVAAYSSHSTIENEYKGVRWDIGNIDIDQKNGIFRIPDEWDDEYVVQCFYFYRKANVTYTHKNFNPYTDRDVLKQATLIYMRPTTQTSDRTIFHFVFDRDLNVWSSSDPSYVSNDPLAHEYVNYTAIPRINHSISSDISNYDTSLYSNALEAFLAEDPTILPLAVVRVSGGVSISSVEVVDARSPGGGVHPDHIMDAIEVTNNTLFMNDIGGASGIMDGGRNAIVVKVKQSVIDSGFTLDDIKSIVRNYTEPGVKVIVQVSGDGW